MLLSALAKASNNLVPVEFLQVPPRALGAFGIAANNGIEQGCHLSGLNLTHRV